MPSSSTLDLAAEPGEADEIGKAHAELLGVGDLPGLALGPSEHAAADGLAQVPVENRHQHWSERRGQLLGERRESQRHVLLGVAALEERVGEDRRDRRGEPRHALAEDSRDLRDRLLAEAGVEEQFDRLRGLDLLGGEDSGPRGRPLAARSAA